MAYINERYKNGVVEMLSTTRNLFSNQYIILENGSSHNAYQPYINGMMYESFPTPWEGGGYWPNVMKSYLEKTSLNVEPKIQIINANSQNKNNFKQMRWGLGSSLLGNAYFSFDFGETFHGQTWWYDEYNLNLGAPISSAYRVDGPFDNFEKGLWRRDFENGTVFVNSYDKKITYNLEKEFVKKINSNKNSILVKKIILDARDSIILLNSSKKETKNLDKSFVPEKRIKKIAGKYKKKMNIEKNIYKNPTGVVYKILSKNNFDSLNGKINIVDSNNDALFEKVLGSRKGNKSVIKIFNNNTNKLLGVFSAYPEEFRCGVQIAVGDFDGDSKLEIATVPAWGGAHLKIFNFNGKLEKELFFENKNLRSFYNIKSLYDNELGKDIIFLTNY